MQVIACNARIPGARTSNSPAPAKSHRKSSAARRLIQQFDLRSLASAAARAHRRSTSLAASLDGLPSSQPAGIDFAAGTFLRNGRSAGKSAFAGFPHAAIEQRVGERAQHRFGVLPADHFERAKAVRHVDRLVADVPKIARAVAGEDLEQLVRRRCAPTPPPHSAAASSQFSIASMNAWRAGRGGHRAFIHRRHASSRLPLRRKPASFELSIAQKIGSQRSVSGDARLARCAEFTTSTA